MDQMHLAAFLIAGPVAHSHALWRYSATGSDFSQPGFLQPEYYQHIAQVLERGKFDLVFFADRLAVSDSYGHDLQTGLQYGDQDAMRFDPIPLLSMMAASTTHLGLGATRSTTYYHPFHIARTFATLDHLTHGRAAWNVVTSVNDAEAQNFGLEEHLAHDARYDRADEFMEVAFKLWQSWQPDALILNRETGQFADPTKVDYVHHQGQWFRSRGPLNVPRSPQERPVIIQAGSSGRGRAFATRWADVIFTIQPTLQQAQKFYHEIKSQLAAYNRQPEECKILVAVMPFVAETEAIARAKQAQHNSLVHPLVGLSTLSNHLNYDLSQHPLDKPLNPTEIQGMRGMFELVMQLSQHEELTLAEIGQRYGSSVLVPQWIGTAEQITNRLEEWFFAGACDGFVISPAYLPRAFEDFVQFVIPELQRRRLFRTEYSGKTLRQHLKLQPLTHTEGAS
jgi:FMN-dependent oxidoreductase (nitrilotriacetate monooxygenase family)